MTDCKSGLTDPSCNPRLNLPTALCRLNPRNPACGARGNLINCAQAPLHPTCPPKIPSPAESCEENPRQPGCENPPNKFCRQNPADPRCIKDGARLCQKICQPKSPHCVLNPDAEECQECVQYCNNNINNSSASCDCEGGECSGCRSLSPDEITAPDCQTNPRQQKCKLRDDDHSPDLAVCSMFPALGDPRCKPNPIDCSIHPGHAACQKPPPGAETFEF